MVTVNRSEFLDPLEIRAQNMGTFSTRFVPEVLPEWLSSLSPVDGGEIASISLSKDEGYEEVIGAAVETFHRWRQVPAPQRGQLIRAIGEELRAEKRSLGQLVAYEVGKIIAEGEGEVQEAIDIADFAVGLSRQLYGSTMHSERPHHRMYEQWHPLGPIGVITAFNFPVAVWAWNAMIAAVCGDTVIWKPSEHAPLTSLAVINICRRVTEPAGFPALFTLLSGRGADVGRKLAADNRVPLISATGSCAMGRDVGAAVAARCGRSLLELGGNNAVIVLADADLALATRAIVFGAVGTAGQRCTTTRRLFVEEGVRNALVSRLVSAYKQIRIGNPFDPATLMGPLIHTQAVQAYLEAIERAKQDGAEVLCGAGVVPGAPSSLYVKPTILAAPRTLPLLKQEVFAPILSVVGVSSLDEALALNNEVAQGLSSSLFTNDLRHAERFLSHAGSDCGIANVNIGTSGAEIGGAFGGEKDTGGGREAGSDSWRAYMRRQTNTINWGTDLPLAQGIQFGN